MNVGAKWRLLLLLLLLCFVLNSHSSSARWGCVWISSLCQCAKSGWSQTNCTGQFPYMFYIWLKLSHIYRTDRQVMTEALPGCLFLHLERDSFLLCFFVPPSFRYSGGCLYFHLQAMVHSSVTAKPRHCAWCLYMHVWQQKTLGSGFMLMWQKSKRGFTPNSSLMCLTNCGSHSQHPSPNTLWFHSRDQH